jgi:hypothetical protein
MQTICIREIYVDEYTLTYRMYLVRKMPIFSGQILIWLLDGVLFLRFPSFFRQPFMWFLSVAAQKAWRKGRCSRRRQQTKRTRSTGWPQLVCSNKPHELSTKMDKMGMMNPSNVIFQWDIDNYIYIRIYIYTYTYTYIYLSIIYIYIIIDV